METFSPYDINQVDSDLVIRDPSHESNMKMYTAIVLGLIAAITLAVVAGFCFYLKRNRDVANALAADSMPGSLNLEQRE